MENDTFGGAILAWVKSAKAFLTDYCLWSTFRPESIDIDDELDMECLDAGMFLFKEYYDAKMALEACYQQAFEKDDDKNDVVVLMEE